MLVQSNRVALIWNIAAGAPSPVQHVLTDHTRAITDLHWSPIDLNLIATAAFDGRVNLWDIRTPQMPAGTFCCWTGILNI